LNYKITRRLKALLGLSAALSPLIHLPSALADQIPTAGELKQSIDRRFEETLPQVLPDASLDEPAVAVEPAPGEVVVEVKRFDVEGNTLVSDAELNTALASFTNRPVSLAQLNLAVAAVSDLYKSKSRLVRAFLPRQDVTSGVVVIKVVEGIYSGLVLEEPLPTRVDLSEIEGIFDAHQTEGDYIDLQAVDRALLLADDLPGVIVAARLTPGANQGETSAALKFSDEPASSHSMTLANNGSYTTGRARVAWNSTFLSPAGFGDLLRVNVDKSEGVTSAQLDYSAPKEYRGWRLGMGYSAMQYRVILPSLADLDARGRSHSIKFRGVFPLERSRDRNTYFTIQGENTRFRNQTSVAGSTSAYSVEKLTLTLNGNRFDQYLGGGANSASLSFVMGDIDPREVAVTPDDESPIKDNYSKLSGTFTRQQAVVDNTTLFLSLNAQMAHYELDSSEKFSLGGDTGVRAYPKGEASGDAGYLASLELRHRFNSAVVGKLFCDQGRVWNYRDLDYTLRGCGIGADLQGLDGWSLQAAVARRVGSNPNQTVSGKDQDGTLHENRLWLSASYAF